MKKKNLMDIEAEDRMANAPPLPEIKSNSDIPRDEQGNPLILPPEIWQKTVVSFDKTKYSKKRAHKRIDCYGDVAFFNKKDMIVAIGDMRKLSRKGASFEVFLIDSTLDDIFYLEFYNLGELVLNQVKVDIRVGQLKGKKLLIGVEFIKPTHAFQERLDTFIAGKLGEMGQFEEFEDI
jgi:hypothetical protein